jgi:hypothetical protein
MSFKALQKYPALAARYNAYQTWHNQTPAQRQASYATVSDATKRASIARVAGYVSPFNNSSATRVYIPTKIISSTQTGQGAGTAAVVLSVLTNYITTETQYAALQSPIEIQAKKYKFAKLALTTVSTGEKQASRITGVSYNKPNVDTVRSPFGQASNSQSYESAIAAIQAESAFTDFLSSGTGKNRFHFTPEG